MTSWSATIQLKTTEQHFPVVLFIILYKGFLIFEFVDEILMCKLLRGTFLGYGSLWCAGGSNLGFFG